jgi:hypothetical protein
MGGSSDPSITTDEQWAAIDCCSRSSTPGATFGAFVGGAVGESFGARWILITGCLIVPSTSYGLFVRYGR